MMFCILRDGDGDGWDGLTRALYKVLCRKEEGGRTMEGRYLDWIDLYGKVIGRVLRYNSEI